MGGKAEPEEVPVEVAVPEDWYTKQREPFPLRQDIRLRLVSVALAVERVVMEEIQFSII